MPHAPLVSSDPRRSGAVGRSFAGALCGAGLLLASGVLRADPPGLAYVYPAGGQRGTTVDVRIGGYELHEAADLQIAGPGISGPARIARIPTVWFEGPLLRPPASSRKEDYPQDYGARFVLAADAPPGLRRLRAATAQGLSASVPFVVGDLKEVVEQEAAGDPVPVAVPLPVTVNGRVFPREDVDVWTFEVPAGRTVTAELHAARLGSTLDARLALFDPAGEMLTESFAPPTGDAVLRFTPRTAGRYALHVTDSRGEGTQTAVYRLTISAGPWVDMLYPLGGRHGAEIECEAVGANLKSNRIRVRLPEAGASIAWRDPAAGDAPVPLVLDLSDRPEAIETAPQDRPAAAQKVAAPVVLNGRIRTAGDVDHWAFDAKQGDAVTCEVAADRLGSPLDSVLELVDAAGTVLATADDLATGRTDARLSARIPADGTYLLKVSDRLASRGGDRFAYRATLDVEAPPAAPVPAPMPPVKPGGKKEPPVPPPPGDFAIDLPADAVSVLRGGASEKLKVDVRRLSGVPADIELTFEGLPAGVTVSGTSIPKNRPNGQLSLQADATAPLGVHAVRIVARSKSGEAEIERAATVPGEPGEPPSDRLLLAVGVATPFKYVGEFETKFVPRGSVHVRKYRIERNGYEGPFEVRLADRQMRHLQGVAGPTITVPAGIDEFEYPISLAPDMHIGRTSRSCVALVGVVKTEDGREHKVGYSSQTQNDQIIAIVGPGRLGLEPAVPAVRVEPGTEAVLVVRLARDRGLEGPTTLRAVLPEHVQGWRSEPVVVPAEKSEAEVRIRFDGEARGPWNVPLTIRGTTTDERGLPVTGEARIELVPPGE